MVTPEDSLEDVSLDGPSRDASLHREDEQPQHVILHQEPCGRLRARNPQLASLTLDSPVVLRPSSFEIMGCFTPLHFEHSAGHSNRHVGHPGALQHHHAQSGLNRTRTPYPERAAPAVMPSEGNRRVQVIQTPEVPAGGRESNASQDGTRVNPQHGHQPSPERYSTTRLVSLIIAAAFTLASFLFLAQAVAVITVFRASGKPVNQGYIVECALSLIFFCPSVTGLVLVLAGWGISFPYTLRSPLARRGSPVQPKELELDSFSRPASATGQDVERGGGGVQHQVTVQPAGPAPIRGPAESRERLLRAAASSATVAPSTTQASILTELCDAVSAPDSRR